MPKITEYAKVASMIGVSSLAVIYYLQNVINDMHWKYHLSNREYEQKMSDALSKLKSEIWQDYYNEDKKLENRVYQFYYESDPTNVKRVIEKINEIFESNDYPDHIKKEVSNKLRLPGVSEVYLYDKSIYDTFHVNKQYYINIFNNLCAYFSTFKINNEDNIISEMFSDFIIKNTYKGNILASKPQNILEEFKNQFAGSSTYDTILLMEEFSKGKKDISNEEIDPNQLVKSMIKNFNNKYYYLGYRNIKNVLSLVTNMDKIKTPEIFIRFCDKRETYKYQEKKYNPLEMKTIKFCYNFLNFNPENPVGIDPHISQNKKGELDFWCKKQERDIEYNSFMKLPESIQALANDENFKKFYKIIYEKNDSGILTEDEKKKYEEVKDKLFETKKIIGLYTKYYSDEQNFNMLGSGVTISYYIIVILFLVIVVLLFFIIKNYIYLPVK